MLKEDFGEQKKYNLSTGFSINNFIFDGGICISGWRSIEKSNTI